jgi:hypothetical protein
VDVVAAIERAVARDVGRGSEKLARHTAGSLHRAAVSLLDASRLDVSIITGFYVPAAEPPAAETDGPIGAVQLALAIQALGGRARILTDDSCVPVLAATVAAAGAEIPLDEAPVSAAPDGYTEWENVLGERYRATLTHMVSIERVGPDWTGGPPRNMRGESVEAWTAPLDRLFTTGNWTRIAIGDGGNELGMGNLPHDAVSELVINGERIHSRVGCDHLIVAGTSNWGAAGLVGAMAVLRPQLWSEIGPILDPSWSLKVLEAMVRDAGAVDGVLRAPVATVDGLGWDSYAEVLAEVAAHARNAAGHR